MIPRGPRGLRLRGLRRPAREPPQVVAHPQDLPPISTEDAHQQLQCPLFSKVPPEIRNEIFYLALQEYVHPSKLYAQETYWTRPEFEGPRRVDVALLRTCKKIYVETKVVPLKHLELVVYMGDHSRVPPEFNLPFHSIHISTCNSKFTPAQWAAVRYVHIFPQMYALKSGIASLWQQRQGGLKPSILTLTIRYTDWWWWEENHAIYPIATDRFIEMNSIVLPDSVQKVVVQFEQIESNENQLREVVSEMFTQPDYWYWKREDGSKLVVKGKDRTEGVREWKWQGPTTFKQSNRLPRRFEHHGQGDTMGYVVKEVTWEVARESAA